VEQKNEARPGIVASLEAQIGPAPELSYNLGLLLQSAGDHAAPPNATRTAVDAKPDFSQALLNLGHALSGWQRRSSTASWNKAVQADPQLSASISSKLIRRATSYHVNLGERKSRRVRSDSVCCHHVISLASLIWSCAGAHLGDSKRLAEMNWWWSGRRSGGCVRVSMARGALQTLLTPVLRLKYWEPVPVHLRRLFANEYCLFASASAAAAICWPATRELPRRFR